MSKTIFNSFELLYLYVENIRCFESQEFVFTTEYNIKYDKETRELNIEERHDKDYLKGFFGPNISNINVIVGKNGSGKSTVLQILGYNNNDRKSELYEDNLFNIQQKWFAIYKTNLCNHFYIEGLNNTLLNNNEKNNSQKHYSLIYNNITNNYTSFKTSEATYVFFNKKNKHNDYTILSSNKFNGENYGKNILRRKNIIKNNYSELYELTTTKENLMNLLNIGLLNAEIRINLKFQKNNILPYFFKDNKDFEFYLSNIKEKKERLKEVLHLKIIDYFFSIIKEQNDETIIDLILSSYANSHSFNKVFEETLNTINKKRISLKKQQSQLSTYELATNLVDNILNLEDHLLTIYDANLSMKKQTTILLEFNNKFNNKVYKFLQSYDDFKNDVEILTEIPFTCFEILFGNRISEGELNLLSTYACIYHALKNSKQKSSLIILDEPDQSLHPDWCSKFIYYLTNLSKETAINNKKDRKYQFIISTHSPFMLSDIPKEYITKINVKKKFEDDKNSEYIREVYKANNTFASNYYDLVTDSFFLDSALGAFANEKLNEVMQIIQMIMTPKYKYNNLKPENLNELNNNSTYAVIKNLYANDLNQIINLVNKNKRLEHIINSNTTDLNVNKIQEIYNIITNIEFNNNINDILKKNHVYENIDQEYIYKKLYNFINVIDEPFIKNSIKDALNNSYSNISKKQYINSEIELLEKKLIELKKLKESGEKYD